MSQPPQVPRYSLLIDGQFRDGTSDDQSTVFNPATEEALGELKHASPSDVLHAVQAAARAFDSWRKTSPFERAKIMRRTAQVLRDRCDGIARIITLELGKPLAEAAREIETAAEIFEWAAGEAQRSYGRQIPARSAGLQQAAQLEPIGPVAAFSGWNAPAITPARKISGAIAAGCSIVIKPSEETPGAALAIAAAMSEAGLPAGVLNIVFGDPAEIAGILLAAPEIRMVSFTGATSIGKMLGEKAARTLKHATLELGGHAPVIVLDDVDVDAVALKAVAAKYRNSGQVCTSPTRFYIHQAIYERFVEKFAEHTRALRVGDGLDPRTQMGPLKNRRRREAIAQLIEDARQCGARIVAGGSSIAGRGFFHEPTAIADVDERCRASHEEPFGPLALLSSFGTLDEAIAKANRLPFGLAAYAFTRSLEAAERLADEIESGVVCINDWQASLPETPFGGIKDSGLGIEGGTEGLREFQRVKCIRRRSAA